MRIKFAEATGCPYGQFVVYADTEEDRIIIKKFFEAGKNEWKLWHHGTTYSVDRGLEAFNFGWIKASRLEEAKPPIGIMPEWLWKEKRIEELTQAISRQIEVNNYKNISVWSQEISKLSTEIQDMKNG